MKEGRLGYNPNPERPKEHVKKGVNPNATRKRPRKKRESDQGRLVHGIKNALATCEPMVGFSFRRRMLYSYHFSPYGM